AKQRISADADRQEQGIRRLLADHGRQSLQAAVEQYGVHAIGAGIACVVARQLDQAKRLPRADMDFPHDPKALAELDTSSGEASIEGGDIELPDALRAQLGQRSVRRPWRRTGSQCRG